MFKGSWRLQKTQTTTSYCGWLRIPFRTVRKPNGMIRSPNANTNKRSGSNHGFRVLETDLATIHNTSGFRVYFSAKHSVVRWHPFSLFWGGCPAKNGLPKKGFSFFSRVTEQLRSQSVSSKHHSHASGYGLSYGGIVDFAKKHGAPASAMPI